MSQELKPCKCCDGGVATHQGGKSVHYLRCNNCEWRTHFYGSWDKAYAEWNNHHAAVPPDHSEQALDMVPDVGKVEVQRFWAEEAQNIRCVRAEDFDTHVTRLQAEIAALQQRLNVAD